MKIAGRAGHNVLCPGASALVDEVAEDRPIFFASKKYLEKNNNFIDCTPDPVDNQSVDLYYGINKANNNNTEFFYSVHLNKAYERYDGAIGSEIWLYPLANQDTINKANRILANFAALGFKNRGIKWCDNGEHRYAEIYDTNCEAMIIECFFLEATRDVEIYKSVGADALGFAIANGIDPSIVKENSTEPENPTPTIMYRVIMDGVLIEALSNIQKAVEEVKTFVDSGKYKNGKVQRNTDGVDLFMYPSPLPTIDYENELCRIIVNGNNVIALTGKNKCINYAKENYEGHIKVECIKDNVNVAEFDNIIEKPTNPILVAEENIDTPKDNKGITNPSTNNEESKQSNYNWWQLILKFFVDLINMLFKKK